MTRFAHFRCLNTYQMFANLLNDCLNALRPGGILILGVPNNDGLIGFADAPLNMPPHHMGLWKKKSLVALTQVFPLDLKVVEVEPLVKLIGMRP